MSDKKVTWTEFKQYVQDRGAAIQYVETGASYYMNTFEGVAQGVFSLTCALAKNGSVDVADFEANFKTGSNTNLNMMVTTQYEKDDKTLKLSKGYAAVDANGQAVIYIEVPGVFGVGPGRWLTGGYGISQDYNPDDYVCCYVEDKDRIFAMMVAQAMDPAATEPVPDVVIQGMGIVPGVGKAFPHYPILQSYTDLDQAAAANHGWYFWPLSVGNNQPPVGEIEINPIGGYGFSPSGFYLKIVYQRPAGVVTGAIRVNIDWGKRD